MSRSVFFRALMCFLLWGLWTYQVRSGKVLGGFMRERVTEKEKPNLYFGIIAIQGFGFLVISIWLICDVFLS